MAIIQLPQHDTVTTVMTITDPRDGSEVGSLPCADADAIGTAVRQSVDAFGWWSRTPAEERGALLRHAAALVAGRAEQLARLNTRETGRPFEEALAGVQAGVRTLLQYAELGPLHRGRSLRGAVDAADYTIPEPRGVVVAVTPWNDPVAVAAGLIGAALVTGNTVIHKPSERCPHVGALLGEVLEAALPAHVVQTVLGGSLVGTTLISQLGVDVIAHVGSTVTGQRIARVAVMMGTHVIRENGGNDPLIVDADVDAEWAAQQAALGAFANSGQLCTAVERIYVHEAIAGRFIEALVAEAARRQRNAELGPMVDTELRGEVHRQVTEAVAQGAIVLCGGELPGGPGAYYPPTVLTSCRNDMEIMTEETFGPVAPVQVVASFDEAIDLASADRYGLSATVLTRSMEHAHRAIGELPVGTVKVNSVFGGAPGGSAEPRGDSGTGFGYGPELLDELTTTKVVHLGLPA